MAHVQALSSRAAAGQRQAMPSYTRGSSARFERIVAAELTAVVRIALGNSNLMLLDWEISRAGRVGNPVSAGAYRIVGRAQDGQNTVPWSVVLKIVHLPPAAGESIVSASADVEHWNYWKREIEVYRSGLLADLPVGLGAPQCYAIEERPGGLGWLWLEDVADAEGATWRDERYRLAARHLGRFNGHHWSRESLPTSSWLSVGLLKQWCAAFLALERESLRRTQEVPGPGSAFRRLLSERDRLFKALDGVAHSLCHRDASPDNLVTRHREDGSVETVALDWGLAGIAPLGEELAQLSVWAAGHVPGEELDAWERRAFDSYVEGLRDCAWRGDTQAVRFGYTATAALRVGLWTIGVSSIGQETSRQFVEDLAAEALDLLDVMA